MLKVLLLSFLTGEARDFYFVFPIHNSCCDMKVWLERRFDLPSRKMCNLDTNYHSRREFRKASMIMMIVITSDFDEITNMIILKFDFCGLQRL